MTQTTHIPSDTSRTATPTGRAHKARATKRMPWILRVVLTWDARYRMRRKLAELPDWALEDAGLTRDEIAQETRKYLWQD